MHIIGNRRVARHGTRPGYHIIRGIACAAAATLALAALPLPLMAQQRGETALRLGDVYRRVASGSPRVAAAAALGDAAEARVAGAGRWPDPTLQLGWMNYVLPDLAPMETLGMVQLQAMQMLPLGGKLGAARSAANASALAARERSREVAWETRAQAAMAFYELYAADVSLATMRETLRILEDIARTAESMYRVGQGRQVDVLRAQVEIARMSEDTTRMQAMRAGMAARLAAVLGMQSGGIDGSPQLPRFPQAIPSLDSLERLAAVGRPMLRAAEQDVSAAGAMRRMARAELIPDIELGVALAQRGVTMPAGDPAMPAERAVERMGSLMVGMSVPVFGLARQRAAIREAEAMEAMAIAELSAMSADTRGRLGETYASLLRARRLAALYRATILPQAEAVASSAIAAYRVGQVDFMTLLDARMTINTYRQELARLEAEEGKSWAELEMLVGRTLIDTPEGRND